MVGRVEKLAVRKTLQEKKQQIAVGQARAGQPAQAGCEVSGGRRRGRWGRCTDGTCLI